MATDVLTREQILDAAEDVLRRYGPAKTTVVDVARELGVSHGSVYRHFESKAALRDAVAARWLEGCSSSLAEIAAGSDPAAMRLRAWLDALVEWKQGRARQEPELFATYVGIAGEAREVIGGHVKTLVAQLTEILAHGVERGEFATADTAGSARAAFDATARFHNPANAAQWADPAIVAAYEAVRELVIEGLRAGAPAS